MDGVRGKYVEILNYNSGRKILGEYVFDWAGIERKNLGVVFGGLQYDFTFENTSFSEDVCDDLALY